MDEFTSEEIRREADIEMIQVGAGTGIATRQRKSVPSSVVQMTGKKPCNRVSTVVCT